MEHLNVNLDLSETMNNLDENSPANTPIDDPAKSTNNDHGIALDDNSNGLKERSWIYSLHGHISSAVNGVGRSDSDRQYIFCNQRPVDIPRFVKAINEVNQLVVLIHLSQFYSHDY